MSSWESGRHRLNFVDPKVDLEDFLRAYFGPGFLSTLDSFLRTWSLFSCLPRFAFLEQLVIRTCKNRLEVGIIASFKIKSSSSEGKMVETYTPDDDSSYPQT